MKAISKNFTLKKSVGSLSTIFTGSHHVLTVSPHGTGTPSKFLLETLSTISEVSDKSGNEQTSYPISR